MNTETTTESQTNGVTPPTTETKAEATKAEKPWIAAGFKTRDEWRASTGKKTAKKTAAKETKEAAVKKPAKAKKATKKAAAKKTASAKKAPAKSPAKAKAKKTAKLAGGKLHNYPSAESKPSERKAAAERTAKFMKATAKREEPNADEAKVWKSVKVGSETNTDKMSELFSGNSAKRRSRVRNALRWLRASKKFQAIKGQKGHYKRIA